MTTNLLLRIGVAFAFIYPAISGFVEPIAWIGYFPGFIQSLPVDLFIVLNIFGAVEIILALWILSGKKILIPCVLGAFMLVGIVTFNLSQIDILFRDVAILFMLLALISEEIKTTV